MHTFRDLSKPDRLAWRAPALVMAAVLLVLLLGVLLPNCAHAEDGPPPEAAPTTMLVPTAAGCEGVREDEALPLTKGEVATFDGILYSDSLAACQLAAGPAIERLRKRQVAALRSWCVAERSRAETCEGVMDAYRPAPWYLHPGMWGAAGLVTGVVLGVYAGTAGR